VAEASQFVQKPFSRELLLRSVRDALDSEAPVIES
jgi:FixJ family two-component response regulator